MVLLSVISYAVSVDCPTLRMFAQGLGMESASPSTWSLLQGDCCVDPAIICFSDRVTDLFWYNMGLDGFINSTAIPAGVTYLSLWGNYLTGTIPSNLPYGLRYLSLDGNQLSGDLPIFPYTIQNLYLGYPGLLGNHFTGTLRLNRPAVLYINNNWITDVIIQDSSTLGTGSSVCDFSNNPLLGNANIAGLTRCAKNGLYSASLLPKTLRTIEATTARTLYTTAIRTTSNALFKSSFFTFNAYQTVLDSTAQVSATILPNVQVADLSDTVYDDNISSTAFSLLSNSTSSALINFDILSASSNRDSTTSFLISDSSSTLATTPDANEQNPSAAIDDPILIYGILAGLFGLCVLVIIASMVFKHPKMHSKFGRKNSFGTLNTMNTVATSKS